VRVLILNSDSPTNRGDRAILSGLIEVVRMCWPEAQISALSQFAKRDRRWFGIPFLAQSPLSVSPFDYLRLLRRVRQADIVLWGGGEFLKDYTNRLGLVYWALKMTGLRLANRQIYGAFQGIGPTDASSSRRMVAFTVNRTSGFITRDVESADKLRGWGTRIPVTASFDPAVMAPVAAWSDALSERVQEALGVDSAFIDGAVGVGMRRWFHYRRGGWLPYRLRGSKEEPADFRLYREQIVKLVDRICEDPAARILFVPMHMAVSEGDDSFAREIVARMRNPERARVLDSDVFSPAELSAIIGRCRYMIATRLHSAILAACARVPAIALYYVPKARLFYEQLNLTELSLPIEVMLDVKGTDEVWRRIERVQADRDAIVATIDRQMRDMTERIVADARRAWPNTSA
jgi:polysaccharide pyruvyl transferase WcaK-like protein